MMEQGTGKRLAKRQRLEGVVGFVAEERLGHEAAGLIWLGVTKAALQKRAGVGKNYIDMLDPGDDLAKRIKPLLRRADVTQSKQDVERRRLERARELENQLALQALENQHLTSQLNRARSELDRANQRLAAFERHYEAESREKPNLTLMQSNVRPGVIRLPQNGSDDA